MASETTISCSLCGKPATEEALQEANWATPELLEGFVQAHPYWQRADGACPACVQQALLQHLLRKGDEALHDRIQSVWPLDAEAAFGALPTPLRMHADPRYTGKGVTIAMIDSGFYPHPDLLKPHNRIRAWVEAGSEAIQVRYFNKKEKPQWPGWQSGHPAQWHGLMTSVVAAGNGWLSHGLYRGLASEAEVVLIQVREPNGRISNASIARALRWLEQHASQLNVRVVNLSVAGDPVHPLARNAVDQAVTRLVQNNITVVAAAGNNGERYLLPPATAPAALTIGGLDDKNTFDHHELSLWHSNYGQGIGGVPKPELVAPSIWVVAPILPGTDVAQEAQALFKLRTKHHLHDQAVPHHVEQRLASQKLVTPHYQHVDGTSFAAPLVSSIAACLLEANSTLAPSQIRDILMATAHPVPGASRERQGAGAVEAGAAITMALHEKDGPLAGYPSSPQITAAGISFLLHDHNIHQMELFGTWDNWAAASQPATQLEAGIWQVTRPPLPPGRYLYKFLLDGHRWLDDPANPHKAADGYGGFNTILEIGDW